MANTGNNPGNPNASGWYGSPSSSSSSISSTTNTGNNPANPNASGWYSSSSAGSNNSNINTGNNPGNPNASGWFDGLGSNAQNTVGTSTISGVGDWTVYDDPLGLSRNVPGYKNAPGYFGDFTTDNYSVAPVVSNLSFLDAKLSTISHSGLHITNEATGDSVTIGYMDDNTIHRTGQDNRPGTEIGAGRAVSPTDYAAFAETVTPFLNGEQVSSTGYDLFHNNCHEFTTLSLEVLAGKNPDLSNFFNTDEPMSLPRYSATGPMMTADAAIGIGMYNGMAWLVEALVDAGSSGLLGGIANPAIIEFSISSSQPSPNFTRPDQVVADYGDVTITFSYGNIPVVQQTRSDPIILDLNGNGIDVSFGTNAAFDYDGDGFREQTAWAAPEDGFLVIDLNADGSRGVGDGIIDQGRELAFAQWGTAGMTDLQALAEARDTAGNLVFDTNGDGVLNASDTSWGEMKVWQDFNQDGVTDAGELQTLESLGITQIKEIAA